MFQVTHWWMVEPGVELPCESCKARAFSPLPLCCPRRVPNLTFVILQWISHPRFVVQANVWTRALEDRKQAGAAWGH